MKSPLLVLAICFALGILVADLGPFSNARTLLPTAALCLLGGLLLLRARRLAFAASLAAAGFAVAGMTAAALFQSRFPQDHIHNIEAWNLDLNQDVTIEGVLVSAPVRTRSGFSFDLACRRISTGNSSRAVRGKSRIRLFTPPDRDSWKALEALDLHYGEAIRAPIRLRKPTVYRNPGNFNYQWWLESIEDISWEGNIRSPLLVRRISDSQAPKFLMEVARVRARLLQGIDRLYPPWSAEGSVGAVLKATLLGDRSSLDSATVENFRKSGLYHLLVISGLHVGLLTAVMIFFLNLLRVGDSWRSAVLLVFLVGYNLLVEQRAPTLRASLMIGAYLLARYLYRDRDALNAVGLAGLVLLVYKPAWLFEAGFELSFSAALLIAGLAVPIIERTTAPYRRAFGQLNDVDRDINLPPHSAQFRLDLRGLIKWSQQRLPFLAQHPALAEQEVVLPARAGLWVLELMLFSAVLQVGLLMPMAGTFHRITLVGIGLNALAIPLMTILLALAVPTVLLSVMAPAAAVFPGKLLFGVTHSLLALTEFRHFPAWMSYRIPAPPVWVALGYGLTIVILAWSLGRSRRAFAASLTAFIVFAWMVVGYPFSPRLPKGTLEVTALDCGRGEALFSVLPNGTTMLMNAGGRESFGPDSGRWNPGEDVVSPYLWSRGIRKIDLVVLGSGSSENLRAVDAILRNFEVRELLWRVPRVANPAYQDIVRTAGERGVIIREISRSVQEPQGEAILQVLWPPLTVPDVRPPLNDSALVLRITSQQGSLLWRGNTGERVAGRLTKTSRVLSSEILASARPFSDSPTQKNFLERVNPKIVVISGGRYFGGTRRASLLDERLQAAGIRLFRTAVDGAITLTAHGSRVTVRCYHPPRRLN